MNTVKHTKTAMFAGTIPGPQSHIDTWIESVLESERATLVSVETALTHSSGSAGTLYALVTVVYQKS